MTQRSLRIMSYIVLGVAFLSVFAFSVRHVFIGGKKLGAFTQPLMQFSEFPGTVFSVFAEINHPDRLVEIDPNFSPVNKLNYDIYSLNGHFQDSKWVVRLINLRNDSTIHTWFLEKDDWKDNRYEFGYSGPRGPILLEDRSVILSCSQSKNMYRLDKESNIVWHNTDFRYHHGINLAEDGNIWACSKEMIHTRGGDKKAVSYWDNSIAKLDVTTGETMFYRSASQIFIKNGFEYLIYGMGNEVADEGRDPLHLNEIEPVLNDGPYWKKGDLFLSFRHRSLIVLYRPETDKILRLIHGPFLNQHDVDILSESKISFFNNNRSSFRRHKLPDAEVQDLVQDTLYSSIVIYNFADSTFESYMTQQFQAEGIRTGTQGLHAILKNGHVFIENQNRGTVFIFNKNDVLLKKYMNNPVNNMVERPHWVRIYEDINF